MGLFDVIRSDLSRRKAENSALQAALEAKTKHLDTYNSLADLLQEKMKDTPGSTELTGDPNAVAMKSNPSVFDQGTGPVFQENVGLKEVPAVPGITTGNKLLDMMIPAMVRTGEIDKAATLAGNPALQKQKTLGEMFGGGGMGRGASPGAQGASFRSLPDMIAAAGAGDPNALGIIAEMKAAGVDITPVVQSWEKGNKPVERTVYDSETGLTYKAMYHPFTGQEIPGSRQQYKGEEVQYMDQAQPGGGSKKVPVRGRMVLPMKGAAQSTLKPFNIAINPGDGQQATVNNIVGALQGATGGELTTELGASQKPITIAELDKWINPNTGQHPTKPRSTDDLSNSGYVPFTKLEGAEAARFSNAVGAMERLPDVTNWLFPEGKSLNYTNWAKMKSGVGEGATMKGKLLQATWAQLRNLSGAAVTDQEITGMAEQYVTNMLAITNPEGVKDGIKKLYSDLEGYTTIIDPTGINRKIMKSKATEYGKPSLKMPGKDSSQKIVEWTRDVNGKLVQK